MFQAFTHGLFLALGLIIPLGMQNVFVFNQGATQKNLLRAMPTVITAAFCDVLLIAVAVLGLSLIILEMEGLKFFIFVVGAIFLLYMGRVTWKAPTVTVNDQYKAFSVGKQISFALSVSLLNPHAIIDTIAVIGSNSLNYAGHEKLAFVFACMFVSCVWFLGLAILGSIIKKLNNAAHVLNGINKISAFIIWGMAIYLGIQAYQMLS